MVTVTPLRDVIAIILAMGYGLTMAMHFNFHLNTPSEDEKGTKMRIAKALLTFLLSMLAIVSTVFVVKGDTDVAEDMLLVGIIAHIVVIAAYIVHHIVEAPNKFDKVLYFVQLPFLLNLGVSLWVAHFVLRHKASQLAKIEDEDWIILISSAGVVVLLFIVNLVTVILKVEAIPSFSLPKLRT